VSIGHTRVGAGREPRPHHHAALVTAPALRSSIPSDLS